MQVFASDVMYPLKSQYTDGIDSAGASLFSNEKVEKPIETGFEKTDEIEGLVNGSQSNQLGVSEESYSGKFALKIQKSDNEIIPICDTEYFLTGHGDLIEEANTQAINPDDAYTSKCNYYTLKIKPMSNSETISFYVKVKKTNDLGDVEEDYALVKSDGDRDGVYSVGADLSRGKWQTVQLNIVDLDEELQNGAASGLYMKANKGSQWLLDDISSGYRKSTKTELDLNEFASGNVIYSGNALRFANNKDSQDYDIGSRVVSGGINISEQLTGVQIDSSVQYALGNDSQHKDATEVLYPISFENDNCVVNNTGTEVLCEKVQALKKREVVPTVPYDTSMTVPINAETEKRFRLFLVKTSTSKPVVTLQATGGASKSFTFTDSIICTDWYESDLSIWTSKTMLDTFMEIKAIEYEPIAPAPLENMLMNQGGSFTVNLGEFTSSDRVNLAYELSYENAETDAAELLIELFEGNSSEAYYTTRTYISNAQEKQRFNNILPKIKANTKLKITNTAIANESPVTIRFSKMELVKTLDNVWSRNVDYVDHEITKTDFDYSKNTAALSRRAAKDIYSDAEKYAVVYPDAEGLVNIGTGNTAVGDTSTDIAVYRILNLSNEPAKALVGTTGGTNVKYGTPVYLHYGMADYVVPSGQLLSIPSNEKVMFISKIIYASEKGDSSPIHYTFVDGMTEGEFVKTENAIIYANIFENNSAYKYDTESKTSKKISTDELICSSPDGTHLLLKRDNGSYYILNVVTNEKEETPLTGTYVECFFNAKNELFTVNDTALSYYKAGTLHTLSSGAFTSTTGAYFAHDFDVTGEYLLWTFNNTVKLFKNTNGIWNEVKSFTVSYSNNKAVLSNDISTAYISVGGTRIYTVDLNTQACTELLSGDIFDMTDDNMLLFSEDSYYTLYNPVTAEKYKLFNNQFVCDSITYNPETNMVTGIMSNGRVIYHRFTAEEPQAKYALSFDGRNSWQAYTGGRWQTVSNNTIPTGEELKLEGMTASAVNSIPASAFEKLYNNDTDVLTVDVAVYMYSDSSKRTPAISNIVVETIENGDSDGVYGIHIQKYNKNDYRKITSLFPVENFGSNAECYYLLYLGNEWLYTYKDNEIVKVSQPANILLSDMSESWLRFKQYGMTAKELRGVPSEVLSELFVNDDYANTEFGVIYVVKTKNEDTSKFDVDFRLGSSSNFITGTDVVVELTMSGGEVKVIDSSAFSATDIEDFLSWIEARQNGNGEIFYRLKNATTQHFINYYMINSISVYNGAEYRSRNQ